MLSADDIREELIRQLEAEVIQAVVVARTLGIAPARVSEMKRRERKVQQEEMAPLAQLLGMVKADAIKTQPVLHSEKIRNLGKVAQGVWLEQTFSDPDEPEFVEYDRLKGDPLPEDLFAVTPEGLSMNLRFPPNIQLICKRIPFGFEELESGALVIVERTAHDLREMTCKLLVIDDDGVCWLHSESDQPQFKDPIRIGKPNGDHHVDEEIRAIGRVLRGVIDYSRGATL